MDPKDKERIFGMANSVIASQTGVKNDFSKMAPRAKMVKPEPGISRVKKSEQIKPDSTAKVDPPKKEVPPKTEATKIEPQKKVGAPEIVPEKKVDAVKSDPAGAAAAKNEPIKAVEANTDPIKSVDALPAKKEEAPEKKYDKELEAMLDKITKPSVKPSATKKATAKEGVDYIYRNGKRVLKDQDPSQFPGAESRLSNKPAGAWVPLGYRAESNKEIKGMQRKDAAANKAYLAKQKKNKKK
jgi:hypothetical protein